LKEMPWLIQFDCLPPFTHFSLTPPTLIQH
jgi:hypothetical protein